MNSSKQENEFVEKFRTLSDEQVKFYLNAPYPKVKEAAKKIMNERGLSVVSKEEYYKQFKDLSDKERKEVRKEYDKDSDLIYEYLTRNPNIEKSLHFYIGKNYTYVRQYLSDPEKYNNKFHLKEELEEVSKHLSKLIKDNPIQEDLSLHRRVYTSNGFFTNLKVGDIYEDKSFSSTSMQKLTQFGNFNINICVRRVQMFVIQTMMANLNIS